MAEIIMFVPRPNPERPSLLETVETKAVEFFAHAPALLSDTAPCEYCAPEKDPA
jgi:hypothetical protein